MLFSAPVGRALGSPAGQAAPRRAPILAPIAAIASLRLRESVSRPLFAVLVLVSGALILSLPRLVLFGFGDESRMVRDLGSASLRLATLLLVLTTGGAVDARERGRGGLSLLLVRPLRASYVPLGRFLGGLGALLIGLSMLSVALLLTLKGVGANAASALDVAGRTALEGAVVLAVATAAGECLPAGAALVTTAALFGMGHLSRAPETPAGRALAALVPDLEAIGAPPIGAAPRTTIPGALALAALGAGAYLSLAAAVAEAREPGRHGGGGE